MRRASHKILMKLRTLSLVYFPSNHLMHRIRANEFKIQLKRVSQKMMLELVWPWKGREVPEGQKEEEDLLEVRRSARRKGAEPGMRKGQGRSS